MLCCHCDTPFGGLFLISFFAAISRYVTIVTIKKRDMHLCGMCPVWLLCGVVRELLLFPQGFGFWLRSLFGLNHFARPGGVDIGMGSFIFLGW